MLFVEEHAPLIKDWIVKRLENNSDADADVLADYVLALLRHDGDVETIRKLFEEEIPDFLREDAAAFTDDVLQAVQYRSYLPGAPPPPPVARRPHLPQSAARSDLMPPAPGLYHPAAPYPTPAATSSTSPSGSRKRARSDRDEGDVDIFLGSQSTYGHPYKQPRRGAGFSQRGGRYDNPYAPRSYPPPSAFSRSSGSAPYGAPLPFAPPPIDANSIMENIQLLQSLLPPTVELPSPVYSGSAPSHRRKQRCRDYDTKGYCSRGSRCNFEHGAQHSYILPPMPAAVEEYDPANAALSLPPFSMQQPPVGPPLDFSSHQVHQPSSRREPRKLRRMKSRAPISANGPNHDKTKTAIVVQNIPNENFTKEEVRGYFSQFGNILEISMQPQNRLATIKFNSWEAANAAWSSPKVIFDNRFVKVFWYKEEGADEATPNGNPANNGTTHLSNRMVPAGKSVSTEPDLDLDEFRRKQLEAQKIHEEKVKKRQEIELQRQELEERQKKLREQQVEARRQLEAKLNAHGTKAGSPGAAVEIPSATESGDKKSSAQTEALKAQLAALEQEANQLGIDPDENYDDYSTWTPRGRGRGIGFRGRGTFVPRAIRGAHGYRGRGGTLEARHAAYAAYSLDNRPKSVALSGVDFAVPENDEALRRYLFSVGEFKEVHATPTVTHVSFKDRKTAEKFMFGVSASNSIHGIEGKIEITWAKAPPTSAKAADGDTLMVNRIDNELATGKTNASADVDGANGDIEEGEIDNTLDHDQGDMDYEAGEW
ncbi:hypothetical protein F4802DRAFT_307360 [Xylaria palmicola]|nr:hypothetical protein F4802DRAFT_307360 [Xylaria palmicola]